MAYLDKYVNMMYRDKLSIIRYVPVENNDGTTGQEQDKSSELSGVPCHISILKADEANTVSTDVDDVSARFKIFTSPSVEIHKGDMLEADKYLGEVKVQSYKGKASDPVFYDLSQEIILLEKRVKKC
ncbi:hypothetical protein EOM57_01095 [Candidatus Saccharibacteria bacterium]|nr:hypothetical protein [Candidatus Saccharibacteria bacterium]